MKKRNSKNHYTFMFFPEGKGTPFTLRIPRYILRLTIISIILMVGCLTILILKIGDVALKLQLVNDLRQENIDLKKYNSDLELSFEKTANIDSVVQYFHRLAGVSDIAVTQFAATDRRGGARSAHAGTMRRDMAENVHTAEIPNMMPVNGWITKRFIEGPPPDGHNGIDIAATLGTPISATAPGVVEDIRQDQYFGLTVEIRHENGFVTRYSHCLQVLMSTYDRVNRGQTIALVGNTGRSTAPHVHYVVMQNGRYVDPSNFMGTHER